MEKAQKRHLDALEILAHDFLSFFFLSEGEVEIDGQTQFLKKGGIVSAKFSLDSKFISVSLLSSLPPQNE